MKRDYADDYGRFEREHWWFRARRKILQNFLAQVDLPPRSSIMEIGAGSGENLYSIYPRDTVLSGVEPDAVIAEKAGRRGPIPVYVATVEALPDAVADGSLDGITMFDVLEHTRDDHHALSCVSKKLKPGGKLLLTVPAYMFLWGQQDVVNLHFRRYHRGNLTSVLTSAGFVVERCTYFNTLLFPPIAAFRLLARILPRQTSGSGSDFEYSAGPLNDLMYHVFASERNLLRFMNLPFGVSIYAEATWKGTP